jgi:hypothetical protein
MTLIQTVPWAFSIATAIWFARMASRAERSWRLWGLMGGALSLVSSTIIVGMTQAVFIPTSHEAYIGFCLKSVFLTLIAVAGLGWCVSACLHAQHRAILQLLRPLLTCLAGSLRRRQAQPRSASQASQSLPNPRVLTTKMRSS